MTTNFKTKKHANQVLLPLLSLPLPLSFSLPLSLSISLSLSLSLLLTMIVPSYETDAPRKKYNFLRILFRGFPLSTKLERAPEVRSKKVGYCSYKIIKIKPNQSLVKINTYPNIFQSRIDLYAARESRFNIFIILDLDLRFKDRPRS